MTHWYVFCKTDLLIERQTDGTFTVPSADEEPVELKPWEHVHQVTPNDGDGTVVKTVLLSQPPRLSETQEMCPLRKSYYKLPYQLYLKAGKCQEILYWDCNTKFCGVCGAPMKLHTAISKRCTQCGKEVWPQLAIAVIVLIRRGNEVLLVHARNFRSDFYGLVAGFVETGETLEEAVKREVMEETSISIKNIRYFASQPWPYPSGLMVGFHADYEAGTLHLQKSELSRGGWFSSEHLPQIPEKLSIARMLIDDWLKNGVSSANDE